MDSDSNLSTKRPREQEHSEDANFPSQAKKAKLAYGHCFVDPDSELCPSTTSLNDIPSDTLVHIFSFLDLETLKELILVNSTWAHFSSVDAVWSRVWHNREHMESLIDTINDWNYPEADHVYALYVECPTWKPSLASFVLKKNNELEDDAEMYEDGDEDELDEESCFGMVNSAPLCPGTLEDQFELIEEEVTSVGYKELVKEKLGVKEELDIEEYEYGLKNKCRYENSQVEQYTWNREVFRRDQGGCLVDGNFSGYEVYSNEREFYQLLKSPEFGYYCSLKGIQLLSRSAGVKYYEPSVVTMMRGLLKNFLTQVIGEASKKLDGKQVQFSHEDSSLSDSDDDDDDTDKKEEEEDEHEKDLKISETDIVRAVHKLFGKSLCGFSNLSGESSMEGNEGGVEDESDSDSDCEHEIDGELDDIEAEKEEAEEEIESPKNEGDDDAEQELDEDDEDFIDDSDLEKFTQLNVESLGQSLEHELIKASICAHEQVYGQERTHREKLYLKNWMGYGPLMFKSVHSDSENSSSMEEQEEFTYDGKSEQDIIEHDRREDLAYFGSSTFDEQDEGDEDEEKEEQQPTAMTSEQRQELEKEYHLRRILREETQKCIKEFFAREEPHFNQLYGEDYFNCQPIEQEPTSSTWTRAWDIE